MGLFNDLGKKFERMKKEAESASEQEATHGCKNCETLLYTDHETCPECDEATVVELG